jgi:hypothetical protein
VTARTGATRMRLMQAVHSYKANAWSLNHQPRSRSWPGTHAMRNVARVCQPTASHMHGGA